MAYTLLLHAVVYKSAFGRILWYVLSVISLDSRIIKDIGVTSMKTHTIIGVLILILALSSTSHAKAPHQIGPFILDRDIAKFSDYVYMDTALPIRHMESIHEVEIKPIKGFKSGLIAYGTCAVSNHIVRIKLKYKDNSKAFFEKLKKRIVNRFGETDEYRGDPFHIVIAWKWSFVTQNNQKISLTLQHNSRDEEEKLGNSIKLSMTSLISDERDCHYKSMNKTPADSDKAQPIVLDQTGWDLFCPR